MKDFDKLFKNDNMYWNPRRTRTYNSLYNFIIGMRGGGKTFGALADCCDRFIDGRGKFIYLRRYSTELDGLTNGPLPSLFQNLSLLVPQHKFECKNDVLYVDDEQAGWAIPLSTSNIRKSFDYSGVSTIVFDEFIIDNKGVYHYLKNEVNLFNTLYQTVVRDLDKFVPVFFLSNAVSVANPYFDFYHLNKPNNDQKIRRFGKDKLLLVENVAPSENVEKVKRSAWYNINKDTDYADYAVDNTWLLDNMDFIEKKTQRCVYCMTLRYKGRDIGIWQDTQDWLYYVSNDVDLTYPRKYSVTADDHKPNVLLLKAAKKLPYMQELGDAYEYGAIRYETLQLKNDFREIMRLGRMWG